MKFASIFNTPPAQRLWRGLTAQGYGHAVNIGLQLASVPILLHAWGDARYGSWLLLSVLPTYLLLSDLGFAQAATNDMTMSMARDDKEEARRTFHSLIVLCLAVGCAILLVGSGISAFASLTQVLNLRAVTEREAEVATIALSLQAALAILNGGLVSGLRAEGRFATMATITNTARLCEGLAVMAAALGGFGITGAAFAMLTVRSASLAITAAALFKTSEIFRPGVKDAHPSELRRLIGPSLSFMAFPIGNAMMIQGLLTLIGLRFPAAVALYATSRTLARLGANVLGSVNHVFIYDYGRTMANDRTAFMRLLKINGALIAAGLLTYTIAMVLIGPWFYSYWTGGRLTLEPALLIALISVSAAEALWAYAQTPLIAINAHARVALTYLGGAGITLGVGAAALGRGLGLAQFVYLQAIIYIALTVLIIFDLRLRLRGAPAGKVKRSST